MYAVIETGGKQHKVEKGMILSVDLLKDEVGKKITILRFRRRKNSMRKIGHRAKHSQIEIKNIKLESK